MPARSLPSYSTGTIAVANGSRTVTGVGTLWLTSGESPIGVGDWLMVGNGIAVMIDSVDSAGQITLLWPWPNATAGAGTAYRIRRYTPTLTGTMLGAIQALETRGSDAAAVPSWTMDGGSIRWKWRQSAGGAAALATGGTGAADGAMTDRLLIDLAGNVGIGGSPFAKLDVYSQIGIAAAYRAASLDHVYCEFYARTAALTTRSGYFGYSNAGSIDMVLVNQLETGRLILSTANTSRLVVTAAGHVTPAADNAYTLGASGARWASVWSATGTIQTSDARTKTRVEDSDLGLDFILALRPVSYLNVVGGVDVSSVPDGTETFEIGKDEAGAPITQERPKFRTVETPRPGIRRHYGLVSQEVRAALDLAGVDDFAGWVLTDKADPTSQQALRYDQFIAPLIKAIHQLAARVATLEAGS